MKKLFSKKLWEILSIVFATLFVLMLGLNHAGTIMEGQLNEMLELQNYIQVGEKDPDENVDYFPAVKNEQGVALDASNIEEYYRQVRCPGRRHRAFKE